MSEVVVVFPFEPVTPTSRPRRKRQASSISLQTGTPAARAATRAGWFAGTPGLGTTKSCAANAASAPSPEAPPEIKGAAERPQLRHGLAELLGGAIVDGGHHGAPRGAELRRGDARARQSQHQHALAREFDSWTHHYLSFKVVNENSAKTSATIQKRTMIFDSLQPASSK